MKNKSPFFKGVNASLQQGILEATKKEKQMKIDKQAVLDKLDFEQFYNEHLPRPIKSSGKDWEMACCPFHEDEKPSMAVNTEHGGFICHGCGEKGDAFSFFMKLKNVGFRQALEEMSKL